MFAIAPTTTGSNFSALDVKPVETIEDQGTGDSFLKGLSGMRDGQQVFVSGYTTPGDGGGGTFYWDSASSATDNGGTVIAADAGGVGRWRRIYSGALNLKQFGAKGDGTTDDSAAIQAWHDALPTDGGDAYAPIGSYKHATKLTFTKRIRLLGAGTASTNAASPTQFLKASTLSDNGVELSGAGSHIEGVAFRGEVGNGGDGVLIKGARIALRDVSVYQMGQDGIRIGTDSGGENCNLWLLDNVRSKSNTRHGIHVSEGAGALADANGGTAMHIDTQSNGADGFYLGNTQLNTLVGMTSQNNTAYGLRFGQYAASNAVFGGDIEGSGTANIRFDNGSDDNAVFAYTVLNATVSDASGSNNNRFEVIDANRVQSGITFPSTAVASSNVNTLDEYKEGTFTPTVVGTTAAGAGTYTTQTGSYVKVGSMVHFQIYLVWTAHTGTGNMKLGALPYSSASASTHAYAAVTVGFSSNVALTAGNVLVGYVESGATTIDLQQNPTGGGATAAVPIDAAGTLLISGSYRALN